MKQLVIMPGGFHPFHAGHLALYQAAQQAFPGADVKVAATNDVSQRPFPFAIKEKLARLAGVKPSDFYQVKSPFQAREITQNYNPDDTELIFVRSEKDANKPPQPGGIKKNGEPAYLQPLAGQTQLEPMSRHAYMAYLPTVEFGSGMTSATEIRAEWPSLDEQGKLDRVMSLYPKTQNNSKLADTVVKMLDLAIMGNAVEENIIEQQNPKIDLTPNFPNYSKLIGEFVGTQNNKLLFHIVTAELNPGAKPTEKIAKAQATNKPIAMAINYVKNRQVVPENDQDEYAAPGLNPEQLRQLYAKMKHMRGRQPFVWRRPGQIGGSHTERELLDRGFKKSIHNTWGGTQTMWNRLAGIEESADYVEEKISR
jgi:hypothetical protein